MSYLLDKKEKRKRLRNIALGIVVLGVLFYFRSGISNTLSYGSQVIFHPVLAVGNAAGQKLRGIGSYFTSKNTLYMQNQDLQHQLDENAAQMLNYNVLLTDDASIKEALGRKNEKTNMVVSAILSKPTESAYDTLVVDAGAGEGIKEGSTVFALGNVPIGRVSNVYPDSAKIILFSNPGEKTQVVMSDGPARTTGVVQSGGNVFMEIIGRGGGNFDMILPRDVTLEKGDQVVLPGLTPYVVAEVISTISDPRDPFTKALLSSPVNVQNLKFVEVER